MRDDLEWQKLDNRASLHETSSLRFLRLLRTGQVKRPPPDPEIVGVSTNGDVGCHRPTPDQYQAFLKWRYRACHHRDGLITGGLLGHRLPVEIMHKAMLPRRRTFPLFVRKVLGCKPQTRFSHLTVKQVEQLQIELVRMKKFHLSDRKRENELRILSWSDATTRPSRS